MAFYHAPRFTAWQGSLFIGALKDRALIRLELDGDKVAHEERLLEPLNERIRDVRIGPDGYVYVLTDASKGRLLKIGLRSEEHTSELQSLMRLSYAVFCLKK